MKTDCKHILALMLLFSTLACKSKENTPPVVPLGTLVLNATRVGSYTLDLQDAGSNTAAPQDLNLQLEFSAPIDTLTAKTAITLASIEGVSVPASISFDSSTTRVRLLQTSLPAEGQGYKLTVNNTLRGAKKEKFAGATIGYKTAISALKLDSVYVNGRKITLGTTQKNVPWASPEFKLFYSKELNPATVTASAITFSGQGTSGLTLSTTGKVITAKATAPLASWRRYTLAINNTLTGILGETIGKTEVALVSHLDTTDKFPRISDEELLTLVQRQTFKYFWDAADANSGLAQERNASPNVVTIGGSGFGVMALIVGVDRGFITRREAVQRWDKITRFLSKADRFHGVWPHWMTSSGRVIPFSANDDGGDLVESAFMAQGLMTVRQFLNKNEASENQVAARIDTLLDAMEWDWYRRGGQNVLYWHWSPRVGWQMNFPLRGWNETMITYVMAAASRTHSIPKSVYTNGYCTSASYRNGRSYYGIPLPLGPDGGKGGPLFFAHYSFLGLNPTRLQDINAQYFTQNQAHSRINYAYCVQNPKGYPLYGPSCWGLTASDIENGYTASDPDNDGGTIAPTAALASMPYTPQESMRALHFFYYKLGDRLWGSQGFYDAFNTNTSWVANSYLAIDQGPIIIMIENYRTQRLWNLFMSSPEVQTGLTKLGFTY